MSDTVDGKALVNIARHRKNMCPHDCPGRNVGTPEHTVKYCSVAGYHRLGSKVRMVRTNIRATQAHQGRTESILSQGARNPAETLGHVRMHAHPAYIAERCAKAGHHGRAQL